MSRPCTEKATKAAMYRRAAKHLEDGDDFNGSPVKFACYALELAEFGRPYFEGHSSYCDPMKAVFAPTSPRGAWLACYEHEDGAPCDETGIRILALCFMAAMVEAGDA